MRQQNKKLNIGMIKFIASIVLALGYGGYKISCKLITEHKHNDFIKQTSQTATEYISQKYGFKPDSISIISDPYPSWVGPMKFMMKYKDKQFHVFSSKYTYDDNISEYTDDYQQEEICSAVEDIINSYIPEGKTICSWFSSTNFSSPPTLGMDAYYDKTNLTEILEKSYGYVEMVFPDTVFSEEKILKKIKAYDLELKFTSFDTEDHMNQFLQFVQEYGRLDECYETYSSCITDYFEVSGNGEIKRLNVSMEKTENFCYSYFSPDVFNATSNAKKVGLA